MIKDQLKRTQLDIITKFLVDKNNFKLIKEYDYGALFSNGLCQILMNVDSETYEVSHYDNLLQSNGVVYSKDLQIYWLIGYLTYFNMLSRNYKK